MKNYEMLYIISSQFTENELPAIRKKVETIVQKYGGIIGLNELLGKKKLAYAIKKAIHGYYIVIEFGLADAANLKSINTELTLDKEILRTQIIIKPKLPSKAAKKRDLKAKVASIDNLRPSDALTDKPKLKIRDTSKEGRIMKNLDEKLEEILKNDNII